MKQVSNLVSWYRKTSWIWCSAHNPHHSSLASSWACRLALSSISSLTIIWYGLSPGASPIIQTHTSPSLPCSHWTLFLFSGDSDKGRCKNVMLMWLDSIFKMIVHPKIKMVIIHSRSFVMSLQTHQIYVHFWNTNKYIFNIIFVHPLTVNATKSWTHPCFHTVFDDLQCVGQCLNLKA